MTEHRKLQIIDPDRVATVPDDVIAAPATPATTYVHITYKDGTEEERIRADSFGLVNEVPGFISLWTESPQEIWGFIDLSTIKKIRVINDNG